MGGCRGACFHTCFQTSGSATWGEKVRHPLRKESKHSGTPLAVLTTAATKVHAGPPWFGTHIALPLLLGSLIIDARKFGSFRPPSPPPAPAGRRLRRRLWRGGELQRSGAATALRKHVCGGPSSSLNKGNMYCVCRGDGESRDCDSSGTAKYAHIDR